MILAAAALEFAARGFAGARVDRIARRARVNKAMLYYHFKSKQRLYRALLRQMFTLAAERLQAIAGGPGAPADKIDRAIAGIAAFIQEHAFFPAIMLREVAEGGAHLDRETLAALAAVPRTVAGIVERGRRERATSARSIRCSPTSACSRRSSFYLAGDADPERARRSCTSSTCARLSPADFVEQVQDVGAPRAEARRPDDREADIMTLALSNPAPFPNIPRARSPRLVVAAAACRDKPPADRVRVSGQVEATDVQVAAQVGGRVLELPRRRRRSRQRRATSSRGSTRPTPSSRSRARGPTASRPTRSCGCCAPARAPRTSARPRRRSPPPKPTSRAADAELAAAQADVERFEALLASNSGSRKQRDDAVTRRDVASARAQGARDRVRAAREAVARLRAGARPRRDRRRPRPRRRRRRADRDAARRRSPTPPSPRRSPASSPRSSPRSASCVQPRGAGRRADRSRSRLGERVRGRAGRAAAALGQPATLFTDAGGAGHRRAPSATSRRRPSSRRATCRPPRSARSWSTASRSRSTTRAACSRPACRSKRRFRFSSR